MDLHINQPLECVIKAAASTIKEPPERPIDPELMELVHSLDICFSVGDARSRTRAEFRLESINVWEAGGVWANVPGRLLDLGDILGEWRRDLFRPLSFQVQDLTVFYGDKGSAVVDVPQRDVDVRELLRNIDVSLKIAFLRVINAYSLVAEPRCGVVLSVRDRPPRPADAVVHFVTESDDVISIQAGDWISAAIDTLRAWLGSGWTLRLRGYQPWPSAHERLKLEAEHVHQLAEPIRKVVAE